MSTESPKLPEYTRADLDRDMSEERSRWENVYPESKEWNDVQWQQHFMNNFFFRLPGGFSRKNAQAIADNPQEFDYDEVPDYTKRELKLMKDIDKELEKRNIDQEQLQNWMQAMRLGDNKTSEEFINLVSDLFVKMRSLGYERKDLIS
jgi:hypothetical protein